MAQHELSNKEIIARLLKSDLSDYDNLLSLLGMANEVIREDKELSRKLANKVRFLALRLCATGDIKYYDLYNKALLFLAQEHKDFDSYLLYVEKNRDPEDRYYQPRRNKIYWLVQKMQRLIDDELDILSISMPPGTGKTTLGEFFISFVMGHYPNTPNLMSSHSGFMTRMFYDAVLNIITSNEYCWSDVFPDIVFEGNNAKEETINLGRWQPFKTLTCRPIRGSLTGVTRCEGFLYVDDLVSGIEEALSIDRLDKLYGEYTTDLKSRKKKKAKEIHIATRWSVHDVIGRLERMYEGNPRAEFIAVPDIDPQTGKSNFDYDYDVGFDEKYFHDMEMSMDDVSYRCLYKSDPIEREGILYHPTELQRYIGGLPDREPDSILAICDTKDTGTDYNFLGVFYQYGDRYYLEDLVFKNIDPGTLDELNSDMLVKHHVQQAQLGESCYFNTKQCVAAWLVLSGMINVMIMFLIAGYLNYHWSVGLLQVGLYILTPYLVSSITALGILSMETSGKNSSLFGMSAIFLSISYGVIGSIPRALFVTTLWIWAVAFLVSGLLFVMQIKKLLSKMEKGEVLCTN